MTVVAGIDLAAGRGTTEIARLTLKARERPRFAAADAFVAVVTDDDIMAALRAYHPAVVAIDAPLTLPAPVASALCGKDAMDANSSPYTRAAERDPIWTELGIRPLPVSFLGGLTFRAICLVARLRDALPESAIIEAFPSGARASLGIRADAQGVKRLGKTTAAARRGLQLALAALIVPHSSCRTHRRHRRHPRAHTWSTERRSARRFACRHDGGCVHTGSVSGNWGSGRRADNPAAVSQFAWRHLETLVLKMGLVVR